MINNPQREWWPRLADVGRQNASASRMSAARSNTGRE
jgi:hypothetical protein